MGFKYISKPKEIEAFKFTHRIHDQNAPKWFNDAIESGQVTLQDGPNESVLSIKTISGVAICNNGDYVIKGPKHGDIYPCKPDVFEMSYEPVVE